MRLDDRAMIYTAAQRFVEAALRQDDSIFTPGQPIWSLEHIDDLYDRIVVHEDKSGDKFEAKLLRQLIGASSGTVQFAAELVYVILLLPSDMGEPAKRKTVSQILALQPNPVVIPADLDPAFGEGIAQFGAGHSGRIYHARWMIEFLRSWKSMTAETRERALADPWAFKQRVFDISTPYCAVEREGLIHIVYPDTFESMVSAPHKREIVQRWASLTDSDEADVDRQLAQVRASLETDFGQDLNFYSPVLRSQWQRSDNPWDAFTYWAQRFRLREEYVRDERDYKLQVSENLRHARDALASGQLDWVHALKRAFGPPNNLTSHYMHSPFLRWCEEHEDAAAEALEIVWDERRTVGDRIGQFIELIPNDVVSGPGSRLNLASFLLSAVDPLTLAIYRATPFKDGFRLLDYPPIDRLSSIKDQYEYALEFLDKITAKTAQRGLWLLDRLDAQSVLWCVTSWAPPREWGESEVEALERYRAGYVSAVSNYWWLDQKALNHDDQDAHKIWEPSAYYLGDGASIVRLHEGNTVLVGDTDSILSIGTVVHGPSPTPEPIAARGEAAETGVTVILTVELLTAPIRLNELPRQWFASVPDGPFLEDGTLKEGTLFPLSKEFFDLVFESFRNRWPGPGSPEQPPPPTLCIEDLAGQLLLEVNVLRNIERLLEAKGQIIFYGPPGTGKTYVARELAKYFTSSGGEYQLVQFHPSYAYEDFVEGYRPTEINGQPGFKRESGPLKRIAEMAKAQPDKKFVLIIDEINRGNVAKVLGELYFLLEYRDQAVSLQYSHEPFELPKNLWVIGTMNTADRTIALIDAALRRRFFFVPFFPDMPPIEGLLGRWFAKHPNSSPWIADVVERANEMLADRHMSIGPSYFMKPDLDEDWVELIWTYQIIPYLEEHFFGEPDRIREFELARLRRDLHLALDDEPIA